MEQKFDLHAITDKTKQLIKFYKEEQGFHSIQSSSEMAENLKMIF